MARSIVRHGVRPVLFLVAISATVGGIIATRDDDSTVFFADDAAPADSTPPVDLPPDTSWPEDWTTVTIYGPESTVGINGSDGVDSATIGGNLTVVSPWEQSGTITVSTKTGAGLGTWSTITLATVVSTEDAKFCDVDQDGNLDVMAGGQGKRIRIWFGPSPFTTSAYIDAATNLQQWMQLACTTPVSKTFTGEADDDTLTATSHGWSTGDLVRVSNSGGALPSGLSAATDYFVIRTATNTFKLASTRANALAGTQIDLTTDGTGTQTASGGMRVWAGGRPVSGGTAYVGYFYSGTPRTAASWTYVQIAQANWLMSLIPGDYDADGDLDVLISERQASAGAGIKGAKWYRFESGGTWTTKNIYDFNGQGDPKFLYLENSTTVLIGGGSDTRPNKLVRSVTADNWASWTSTTLTYPSDTGWYQGVLPCDVTGDGNADYILTHSAATGSLLGVVSSENRGAGSTVDIDHAEGEKYDNALCVDVDGDTDMDIITSEQNAGLGVVYFLNPRLHL